MSNFDEEMKYEFVEEANELLHTIEDDFLALEKQKEPDAKIVNGLFRAMHTIKGTSGFLGFSNITKLSHILETVLSDLRDNKLNVSENLVDALLKGSDILKSMINNLGNSETVDIEYIHSNLSNLLEEKSHKINTNISSKTIKIDEDENIEESDVLDKELIDVYSTEAINYISEFQNTLSDFYSKKQKLDSKSEKHIYRILDSIAGPSEYLGLITVRRLSNEIFDFFINVVDKNVPLTEIQFKTLLLSTDKLSALLNDIYYSNNTDISETQKLFNKNAEIVQLPVKVTPPKKEHNNFKKPKTENKKKEIIINSENSKKETVRLNVDVLNNLMRLAGELVLIRNQQLSLFDDSKPEYKEIVQRLNSVTSEIQGTVIKTRLRPLGTLFNKFPRIIRDMGKVLNKEIELEILGSDVELDKTIIEALSAPLTHLIRNAADHGIEDTNSRTKRGKYPKGKIVLKAFQKAGLINIVISDDGKGIDIEKVKQKAFERGIKTKKEIFEMPENEILDLVLLPGFSTADVVTDISGRGVGMNVVSSEIDRIGGSVELHSVFGKGTEIALRLPLTLAIISSFTIVSGEQRYAIPQVNLERLITIYREDGNSKIEYTSNQEVYRLQNKLLPVARLNEVMNRKEKFDDTFKTEIINKYHSKFNTEKKDKLEIAVLNIGSKTYILIFDSIIGKEEIVVQSLHPALQHISIYSGATILGDGKVALILDTDGIANHANINFKLHQISASEKSEKSELITKDESILLFKNGLFEQFAVPVTLIKRIEQINWKDIDLVGEKEFVTVNEKAYRIIRLENNISVSPCENKDALYLLIFKNIDKPVAILFSEILDISNNRINLSTKNLKLDGIIGTDIINGTITLFLDVYRLIDLAEPEWSTNNYVDLHENIESVPITDNIQILLLEPSSLFKEMIISYLVDDGYIVKTVINRKEAMKVMENQDISLIITDVDSPDLKVFEFIENIRRSNKYGKIPAIALTSMNSDEFKAKALGVGFNEVEKRIDKERLLKLVSELISQKNNSKLVTI